MPTGLPPIVPRLSGSGDAHRQKSPPQVKISERQRRLQPVQNNADHGADDDDRGGTEEVRQVAGQGD